MLGQGLLIAEAGEHGRLESLPHRTGRPGNGGLFRPDEQVRNRIAEIALLSGQALYEAEEGGWNRVIEILRGIRFLAVEGCQQAGLSDSSSFEGGC